MAKVGRKPQYEYWLTEDGLTALTVFARNGLSDEDIAHNCGIGKTALYEWKNRFPEIADALKTSKQAADAIIENALYEKAKKGDVTAMIFWLKNRQPERWRDKHDVDTNITGMDFGESLGKFINKL